MPATSDSLLTNTLIDRSRRRDDARVSPTVFVVGSAESGGPRLDERVITFDRTLAIGRRAREMNDADGFWVVKDDLVSRLHCRINRAEGAEGWEISDLGSRNGTAVDGSLLKAAPVRSEGRRGDLPGRYAAVFRLVNSVELAAIERDLCDPFGPVATSSPVLAAISSKLAKLAPTGGELLLTGETGVGQGGVCAGHPRRQPARRAVRRHQLRGPAARADRERAVRLRPRAPTPRPRPTSAV